MIMKLKVDEILDLLDKGIDFEKTIGYNNNSSKVVHAYESLSNLLMSVDGNTTYIVESGSGKANRPFEMPNLGSVVECLINNLFDKEPKMEYSKHFNDEEPDIMIGCMAYEIKSSLSLTSLCTKVQTNRPIILVNNNGIFTIKKKDITNLLEKNGKFTYNKNYGKHWKSMERKIGF